MDSAVADSTAVPEDSMVADSAAEHADSTAALRAAMAAGSCIAALASAPVPESERGADMLADLRAVPWLAVIGSVAVITAAFGTGLAGVSGAAGGGPMVLAAAGAGRRSAMSGFADSRSREVA